MDSGGGPNFQDINPEELFRQFFGEGGIDQLFAQAFGGQMGPGRGRGGPGVNPLEQMFAQAMGGGGRGGRGGPRMN